MRNKSLPLLTLPVILVLSLFVAAAAQADVKLPAVIDSHMVLQRDMPLPIWGSADADEAVSVKLDDGEAVKTKADAEGKWKVTLPAVKADGKPHKLTVSGKNEIVLEDILIGEVWVGSGQSNMEWQLKRSTGGAEAIAAAKHHRIRLFHVPKVKKPEPADDVDADWKVCSPETVGDFSGVLYFFGLKLHTDLDIPVGLINSSWGGSPIEPWTVTEEGSGEMYNGMIAPIKPLAMRGATWYQGETNVFKKNGLTYFDKMKDLIEGWRKVWGQDFPFYFVQLAPWHGYGNGAMPPVWEAQVASLKIPGTGMAVTTDLVDNIKDIHPQNKLDVGNRLALWALVKTYGKTGIVYSGPLYKSMEIEGNKIRLKFAHVGGGLKSRDDKPLSEFKIAGEDGQFKPATATIDGETVVVEAEGVDKPTQVQFGWNKLTNPNLMNAEGLPASPFQTNDWQGATGE